ncbi:MAG TPA: M20 family metallo-hydrolase [Symbiobacteriaceae bacterium]|nr:M20 family metallo-hydrolase [Symbiobacteriaceae bacterium]
MPVNADRIGRDIAAFAAIGRSPDTPGISRLAFTPEDALARSHMIRLMREAGLTVRPDAVGNLFGLTEAALARPEQTVLMGSHLDTVPSGGAYDGVAGVVAGLEVVRSLLEEGTSLPLGVVVFACEESSRFRMATVGSKTLAGFMPLEKALALTDANGVTYGEALAANGNWDEVGGPHPAPRAGAYLELHVEQGREMERQHARVAVVERIAAPTRLRIKLEGEAAHSGATPLYRRKDALVAAAEVILAVERIAETEARYGTVGTTTMFALTPAAINVVPGTATLGVDLRSADGPSKDRALEKLEHFLQRLGAMREIQVSCDVLGREEPVSLDPVSIDAVARACADAQLPPVRLDSRAGHDAMYMQRVCPTGMVFVPSVGGLSHHPDEYTAPEDMALGTEVLRRAACLLVQRLARPPADRDAG